MAPEPVENNGFPIPIFWRQGSTRNFVEIPVEGRRFKSLEIQTVEWNGQVGRIVELHRPSGELEIYAEPHLELDESWFHGDPAFTHFELRLLQATDFEHVKCNIGRGLVDASASFLDGSGQRVEARVELRGGRAAKALFTPAPHQVTPATLRFLVMDDFRLLPIRGTALSVKSGGESLRPRPFLAPSPKYARFHHARAGADLLLAGLLPRHEDRLLASADGNDKVGSISFSGDGLQSVRESNDFGHFELWFNDPLPNPALEQVGPRVGRCEVRSSLGVTATGRWRVAWGDNGVDLSLTEVRQDWTPSLTQPTRVALRWARWFRRRNERWQYNSTLRVGNDGLWRSSGSWSIVAVDGSR